MSKAIESLKRLAERVRQSYHAEQLEEYDVLQFVQDVNEVHDVLLKYEKQQEILNTIFKALTSNSELIYSRIFEDKAECGWITQEECDKVLEEIKKWKREDNKKLYNILS